MNMSFMFFWAIHHINHLSMTHFCECLPHKHLTIMPVGDSHHVCISLRSPPCGQFYLLALLHLFSPLSFLITCLSSLLLSKCHHGAPCFFYFYYESHTEIPVRLSLTLPGPNYVEKHGSPLWFGTFFLTSLSVPIYSRLKLCYHDPVHPKLKFVLQWHLPSCFLMSSLFLPGTSSHPLRAWLYPSWVWYPFLAPFHLELSVLSLLVLSSAVPWLQLGSACH